MIVANTRETRFKRPITVMHQKEPDEDGKQFDIVCFRSSREKTIPAVMVETTREEMAQRAHTGSSHEGTTH
jgi:hypothetical protein